MVILYGGRKKKPQKTTTMQIRKGVNHMIFYLYAIMEMSVRGKESFCLSPQLCTKPA